MPASLMSLLAGRETSRLILSLWRYLMKRRYLFLRLRQQRLLPRGMPSGILLPVHGSRNPRRARALALALLFLLV